MSGGPVAMSSEPVVHVVPGGRVVVSGGPVVIPGGPFLMSDVPVVVSGDDLL